MNCTCRVGKVQSIFISGNSKLFHYSTIPLFRIPRFTASRKYRTYDATSLQVYTHSEFTKVFDPWVAKGSVYRQGDKSPILETSY